MTTFAKKFDFSSGLVENKSPNLKLASELE